MSSRRKSPTDTMDDFPKSSSESEAPRGKTRLKNFLLTEKQVPLIHPPKLDLLLVHLIMSILRSLKNFGGSTLRIAP
jgi:hypothetical protein